MKKKQTPEWSTLVSSLVSCFGAVAYWKTGQSIAPKPGQRRNYKQSHANQYGLTCLTAMGYVLRQMMRCRAIPRNYRAIVRNAVQ